jgi:hypothetical protein
VIKLLNILNKYCRVDYDNSLCTIFHVYNRQGFSFCYNKLANFVELRPFNTVFVIHNFTNKEKLEKFFNSLDIKEDSINE